MPYPESDEAPQPRPSPSGVVSIPLSLANALFACYYGNGPRHAQSPLSAAREVAVVPTDPAKQPEGGSLVGPAGLICMDDLRGFTPRGVAARAKMDLKPPNKAETTDAQRHP